MCFGLKKQIEPFHTQPYSNYYCFGWFHGTLTPEGYIVQNFYGNTFLSVLKKIIVIVKSSIVRQSFIYSVIKKNHIH